jgi:hypothetical protein
VDAVADRQEQADYHGVICGSAQADLLLIGTDKVAVAVSSVRAHPNGFEFTVHARLRPETLQWGIGPLDPLAEMRTRLAPEKALRLGVLYADDRRAAMAIRQAAGRAAILWPDEQDESRPAADGPAGQRCSTRPGATSSEPY